MAYDISAILSLWRTFRYVMKHIFRILWIILVIYFHIEELYIFFYLGKSYYFYYLGKSYYK